jgi:hypothetical protein
MAARADVRHRLGRSASGVSREYRETTLQILAVARRTFRSVAATHQRLELAIAFFAGVFE